MLTGLDVVLRHQLPFEGDQGEIVEPVGFDGRTGRPQLVGQLAGCSGVVAPPGGRRRVLPPIVLGHVQVVGQLRDGLLGIVDRRRVAADEPV